MQHSVWLQNNACQRKELQQAIVFRMVRSQLFTHLDQTDEHGENHTTDLPNISHCSKHRANRAAETIRWCSKGAHSQCASLFLSVCERAYISALRDFETHRNRDKEKLIKLSVCLQALPVIVNSRISWLPATFQRIPEGYCYHPGRTAAWRLEVWPAAFPAGCGEMGHKEEEEQKKRYIIPH